MSGPKSKRSKEKISEETTSLCDARRSVHRDSTRQISVRKSANGRRRFSNSKKIVGSKLQQKNREKRDQRKQQRLARSTGIAEQSQDNVRERIWRARGDNPIGHAARDAGAEWFIEIKTAPYAHTQAENDEEEIQRERNRTKNQKNCKTQTRV